MTARSPSVSIIIAPTSVVARFARALRQSAERAVRVDGEQLTAGDWELLDAFERAAVVAAEERRQRLGHDLDPKRDPERDPERPYRIGQYRR